MATKIEGVLGNNLIDTLEKSKVLVVGAGGIGCELLKNLVLTGFTNITIVDLDTIEISNLNRQFLFRKEHVGRPKSVVARESALKFNPSTNITAYHDSITESKYTINFFKEFSLVMNALDNHFARSHVNKMCLAAKVPLIESGSSGYKGHVKLHKGTVTECYDCILRPPQKSYPGCTIRNTPSEPIHCIVWAKHLFNQLFGVNDPNEDVSPDSEDPAAVGSAAEASLKKVNEGPELGKRMSTRQWAQDNSYDPQKLFQKLFHDDILYLLSMENLWKTRTAPTPLDWNEAQKGPERKRNSAAFTNGDSWRTLTDEKVLSPEECKNMFLKAINGLNERIKLSGNEPLIWDKDDDLAMNFVTSCSNFRCRVFHIEVKSPFETKSMAGNIIPAIASTNAIVGGLMVMMSLKVLQEDFYQCNTVYVSPKPTVRKELFALERIMGPNPHCYVCQEKPEITVEMDLRKITPRILADRILKKGLVMVAPDVEVDDGKGTIIVSSDPDETEEIQDKLLTEFDVMDGTRLKCDDFMQNYSINVTVKEMKVGENDREKTELFEILGDLSKLNAQKYENGHSDEQPSTSKGSVQEDEDDLKVLEPSEVEESRKRPREDEGFSPNKKARTLELEEETVTIC